VGARRRPISQYANERVGIAIYENGELTDPDDGVAITVVRDGNTVVGPDAVATQDDVGLYSYTLTSVHTGTVGTYDITWEYTLDGVPRVFEDSFTISGVMPYWDALTTSERDLVMNVYHKVSDTFDSTEGGPYLWELYQTQWNAFETIARIMTTDAATYINLSHQPAFVPGYTVGASGSKPIPAGWHGLLEWATYVEFLRHLSRSYIEIPALTGSNVARLDRTRYRQEWAAEYEVEKAKLDQMLRYFKRKFLVGTRRSLLVGGLGGLGGLITPARPHWVYSIARY